jgi:hypothetical protein
VAEPYINAANSADLVAALRADLRSLKVSREAEIWERLQLNYFLLALAERWELGFPVEVHHTSDRNPDFVITTPTGSIGVECSRITNEKLHRLEHLEQEGIIKSTVSLNPFLMDSGDMKNSEIVDAALGLGQFYPFQWSKPEDHDRFWLRCADEILRRKTEAMDKTEYQPCDQYWLLLKDEMSIWEDDREQRATEIKKLCADFWRERSKWFSRVAVQSKSLDLHVTITQHGITPSPSA